MTSAFKSLELHIPPLLEAIPAHVGFFLGLPGSGSELCLRGDEPFPAASVIKIPILMEVYRRASAGLLSLERTVALEDGAKVQGAGVLLELHAGLEVTLEDLCRLMIVVSDNTASNLLLDLVGFESVNALCLKLGLQHTHLVRRFMDTPSPGRDNVMAPRDAARCLESLWSADLLDRAWSDRALAILRRQQYREKIPLMLPGELPVAHKTGELEGVRHDAALVECAEIPYVLALFTREGGPAWKVDFGLARVSHRCYEILTGGEQ